MKHNRLLRHQRSILRFSLYSILLTGALLLSTRVSVLAQSWTLPPVTEPTEYGNILIDRISQSAGKPAVTFSHWSHRLTYTCRVCHLELGFEMKLNATDITEQKNKNGEFCGACHNGKIAFGHTEEHCSKCHNGDIGYGKEKFRKISAFPYARFGNQIDWTEAVSRGLINPKKSISTEEFAPISFNKFITMEPEWAKFPPAVFPHEVHNYWLDCANCHPDIFNIKQRTTKHFKMEYIYEGKFCGVCHLRIAFPMNNCKRCHPDSAKEPKGEGQQEKER